MILVRAPFEMHREQRRKKNEKGSGLEQLRGKNAYGSAAVFVPAGAAFGKYDCAPGVAVPPVAASVEEAADAAESMAEGQDDAE